MSHIFKSRPNELIVTTDGRKLYHSRSVAVVGIIGIWFEGETHFIIERRGTAPGLDKQGMWCLPCGYLDWDESGPDAIKRELWEEVGIDFETSFAGLEMTLDCLVQPWHVKTEPDENRQNVTLRYGAMFTPTGDDYRTLPVLKPNNDCDHPNEVADARWMPLKDIINYDFAFNHDIVLRSFVNEQIF